jgi:hypothetical protein
MSHFLNRCSCWMVWLSLAAVAPSVSAFSLVGPLESWQTAPLGYEKQSYVTFPDNFWEISTTDFAWYPHNLGEEYRWNNPVLYYSFDQTFLDYFGSNGVAAVDAAMAVFNSLSNVDSYSSDLHEFPLEESRVNYTASALHLFDLKSAVMELLIERLGLIDPERWTWCLRARVLPPSLSCPNFDFEVIQRNFDPLTWEPTKYVNGAMFTYEIQVTCTPDFDDAVEFLVDPEQPRYSALATPKLSLPDATFYGWFHTGLTRDDIGGLRYLYATNNMNIEGAGTNTVTFVTATNNLQLLVTSNLTVLATQSFTNDDATLLGLYPDLAIVPGSTVPSFTNVVTANWSMYYVNNPWGPPTLVTVTNYTTNVMVVYTRAFANVVTNSFSTVGFVTVIDTNLYFPPYGPIGFPQTNTTTKTLLTNIVSGDFYILPPTNCGVQILSNVLTTAIGFTNILIVTNVPTTNVASGTYLLSRTYINWFTNHSLAYYPVECVSNSIALRQGIRKITFIRENFDSRLGQFYSPVTNNYILTAVTNNMLFPQTVQRVVTQPDILFSAADLAGGFPAITTVLRSAPAFDLTGELPNLAGPGNLRGPVSFQFNKVGPTYLNGIYPMFVDESGALLDFVWASYDATTNDPVIYPSGASIANLENQVLIQISPPYLPNGTNGMPYRAQLQTSAATPNWQAPFQWSLAPASPALPPGLSVSAAGLISGTPVYKALVPQYNFVIQATDAVGRIAQQSYIINVARSP